MSHDQSRHPHAPLQLPKLNLPRFEMAQRRTQPQHAQPHAAPAPAAPPQRYAPQQQYAPAPQQYAPTPQQYAPAPQQYAPAPQHQYGHPQGAGAAPQRTAPPVFRPTAPPRIAASSTRPAARVSYSPPVVAEPQGLLQRITPAHMGVLMVVATILVIITSAAPGGMSAPRPGTLPALATGSSATLPMARSNVGIAAGDAEAARQAAATPGARTPHVVHAPHAIPRSAKTLAHGGIPSPAAVSNTMVQGGGRAARGATQAIVFRGMPSPAAAERLGPATLPYKPTDGVTLPRTVGERDSFALETHYGATATLPMERPVALPALTPAAAAARSEAEAARIASGMTPQSAATSETYAF